ncbi:unnamed protein product [Symbiodinium microadriaticum]|nr:unnamed protein product [Symbiodinium microadriaticum]
MHRFQAVREFRFTSELRCRLVEIGETATLQLDPLNEEQVKALGSLKQNAVPGTIVKLLAVTKGGPVEAQFLKEELCGLTHSHLEWPDGALRDDLLGKRQNDIMGKLENPEDQPIVDSWRCKDLFTEKTPNARVEKGKLWVSGEFLTAHATKLGGPEPAVPPVQEPDEAEIRLIREEIAREQAGSELVVRERERRESLERLEASAFGVSEFYYYKEAQERVSSGFQDNWIEKCHLLTGGDVREVKRLQVHVRLLKLRPRTDYKAPKAPPAAPVEEAPADSEAASEAAEGSEALDEGTAQQADTVEEAAENSAIEVVEGLKVRRKEDGWLELAVRTLDEYKNDLEILAVKVNFKTGKLNVPKGKKSVEADLVRVQICLADD